MNKKPNFFIVGAPKCGTTALSEYLKEHPNVFMSTPKEPHYFANDMVKHRGIKNSKDYFDLFKDTTEKHLAIGEASVWYLYSKTAIENIKIFNKDAKIIVMLRKPVEMVYSMHSQHQNSQGEDEPDFEKAWNLEAERKKGKSIPKHILHVPNLYYSEIAKYYTQLRKLYNTFPKNQVLVITFDDFKNDTKKIFNEVLDFLILPDYDKNEFPRVNENKKFKYHFVNKLAKKEPVFIRNIRKKTMQVLGLNKLEIGKLIYKLNSKKEFRKPIDTKIKIEVINCYQEEVNQLSVLLKKDLSCWNQ